MLGGEKGSVAFHGDHRPASIYVDGQAISEPSESTQEGTALTFERTYNHVAEVSVFGESVQDGTPTPDSPVPIVSRASACVETRGRNLWSFGQSYSSVEGKYSHWIADKTPFSLDAGTYTVSATEVNLPDSAPLFGYLQDGTRIELIRFLKNEVATKLSNTFRITQPITSVFFAANAGGYVNNIMLNEGSEALPYQPYHASTTDLTTLLDGRELRSLPDGTRDELVVHRDGRVELVQRVGRERMYSSYTNGVAQQAGEGYIVYSKEYDTPSANWGNGGRCTHFTNGDGVKGDASYRIGDGNNWVYIYTTDQDVVSNPSAWFASHEVYFDYPLATPQTIQLPSIDPLPTFHPYTFIDGNGADISAMVRIMP